MRTNTNHGSPSAWLAQKVVADSTTRSNEPAIAASGAWGYVVYTNADTGGILFASNGGVNTADTQWAATPIGTTTRQGANGMGFNGSPVIAASGQEVIVAWIAADTGALYAKISPDHGATWPADPIVVTSANVWDLSAAGSNGRYGIAWAQATGIRARLYAGTWQPAKTIAAFSSTGTWRAGYGTAIALGAAGQVGIAWSACSRSDCSASSTGTKGVSVRWRESANNFASLASPVTIASFGASSSRRVNDYPSVVMTTSPKRYVLYNVASASFSSFSTLIELGTGKP